jgi:ActD protein
VSGHGEAGAARAGGGGPAMSARRWVVAEFGAEEALLAAARALRGQGHAELDLHSPVPIQGADEALGLKRSVVPRLALLGGLAGAASGYLLQWWTVGVDFPINVGGRPPHSPPAFVPVTFELGVLLSSFAIFFGLFKLWGMPRLHHPVFEVEAFRSASVDGLWLSAAVDDPRVPAVVAELEALGARQVEVVEEAS